MEPFIITPILFFIVLIYLAFNRKKITGKLGEKIVGLNLKKLPDEYRIFNDVYIQENGFSTQIDHLVISPYGIFVIETKNYKGDIYGGENAEEWTQNIWGHKYSLRNPIRQNQGHVYCLMRLFNLPQNYFIPIVAFTGRCNLYVESSSIVVYTSQIRDVILDHRDRIIFNEEEVNKLATKLTYSSFETRDTNKEHVKYARKQANNYHWKIEHGICPKCGGRLVERSGQYGDFLGCSNYPRCRFTHKI